MGALRRLWATWKRVAQVIGDAIARIVLTLFYFTLFMPFGLAMRFLGDPLAINPRYRARWRDRVTRDLTVKEARRLS
jgi:hypothetical protein